MVVVLAVTSVAQADDFAVYERLWPTVPSSRQATLGEQLTDTLTDLGNQLGYHLDQLGERGVQLRLPLYRRSF